jgi:hypothetical protein
MRVSEKKEVILGFDKILLRTEIRKSLSPENSTNYPIIQMQAHTRLFKREVKLQ